MSSSIDSILQISQQCLFEHSESDARASTSLKANTGKYGYSEHEYQQRFTEAGPNVNLHGHSLPVYKAALPGGRRMPLLKTMLNTACENNCNYCFFRAKRNYKRYSISAQEMAQGYMQLYRSGRVEGLFLSTGILAGGANTQNSLLDTAEILRERLGYRGYIHMKIMPAAEYGQIERAMQLADRVSINLEAPNPQRLNQLAPQKAFQHDLLQPLKWIARIQKEQYHDHGLFKRPSSATQFVVGAVDENDVEILQTSSYLFNQLGLARIFYSRFNPVKDTPFENQSAANPLREHRLYQASMLLRDYGFAFEELPFTNQGNLPLNTDPKLACATQTLTHAPVEINRASKQELLRIPGIGHKSADIILRARRIHQLRELNDLRQLGINPKRAAGFILLDGQRPMFQMQLL